MSVFFCHGCNRYVDSDHEDCCENPVDGENICESCLEGFLEFADYNPKDFE
jgi:hypothetical protein